MFSNTLAQPTRCQWYINTTTSCDNQKFPDIAMYLLEGSHPMLRTAVLEVTTTWIFAFLYSLSTYKGMHVTLKQYIA